MLFSEWYKIMVNKITFEGFSEITSVDPLQLGRVVQSNFCSRDFVIDHKFSMGLRSGKFQG